MSIGVRVVHKGEFLRNLGSWVSAGVWPGVLAALGGPHALLSSLIWFMVLDYFLGFLASRYQGRRFDRRKAERGLYRRAAMFGALFFATQFDVALGCPEVGLSSHGRLRFAFLVIFNWHEATSILRNVGLCGVTVPEYVRQVVDSLRDRRR